MAVHCHYLYKQKSLFDEIPVTRSLRFSRIFVNQSSSTGL